MSEELKPKQSADFIKIGFDTCYNQMKSELAEKDREIARLKHKLNNIKDTLTKYHDVSLSKINAKEAEGVHFFVFKFSSALLEIINDNK